MAVTRTIEIPPRGHTVASSLREILSAGSTTTRIELKPQSPFAGDPEFDTALSDMKTTPGDWTVLNGAVADAINAHTTQLGRLHIDPDATSLDMSVAGAYAAPLVYQVLTGNFDVYAKVNFGTMRNYHQAGLAARSSSTTNDYVSMFLQTQPNQATPYLNAVYASVDGGAATIASDPWTAAHNASHGRWLYVRLARVTNTFTGYYSRDGKTWTSVSSAVRADIPSTTWVGFSAGTRNTLNLCRAGCDFLRTWPPYVTTSPVSSVVVDSGVNGTTWDMSTFAAHVNPYVEDAGYRATVGNGTLTYQYGADNSSPPALNGADKTEAQMQAESDPSGRYFKLQVKYTSANGYELSAFTGASIGVSFTAAAAAGPFSTGAWR